MQVNQTIIDNLLLSDSTSIEKKLIEENIECKKNIYTVVFKLFISLINKRNLMN